MTEIRDLLSYRVHVVANLLSRGAELRYRREFGVSLWEWRTIALLGASDEPALQPDELKSSPIRSWLAVYALVTVVEEFGDPDDISREAIQAAFEAAEGVDMLDLVPDWTPRGGTGEGLFGPLENAYYYQVTFDPASQEFVIGDEQLDLVQEIDGNLDYPQPGE